MVEESISQELTLKNNDERRNYFLEDIEHYELMVRNRNMVSTTQIILNTFLF